MFIHIGSGYIIRSDHIISMIDYNAISSSSIMEEMIRNNKGKVVGSKKNAKSVVITTDLIYYSTLSISTLKKRANTLSLISKLDDYSEEIKF